jgi:hypothetical protein
MGHGQILLKMMERNGRILELKDDPLFMLTQRLSTCRKIIWQLGRMDGHRLKLGLVMALWRLRFAIAVSGRPHIFEGEAPRTQTGSEMGDCQTLLPELAV